MSMTDYEAQQVLNTARGSPMAAWTPRLALFLGDPRSGGLEVTGGSYVRMGITFAAPVGRVMVNTNQIDFPAPSATWGEIQYAAVVDAAVGGNVRNVTLLSGSAAQRTMTVGVAPPSFGPGTVSMQIDA